MDEETESSISGWTIDTLFAHFTREMILVRELIYEYDKRYQERYDARQKALEAALASADKFSQAMMHSTSEAVNKAQIAADKRFELLNELRSGVATSDQINAVEKIVGTLTSRVDRAEASLAGGTDKLRGIYAALAGAVAVIAIVVFVANNLTK